MPELNDAFAGVEADRIDAGLADLSGRGWIRHEGQADERSMRLALALALDDLVAAASASAVTVNCHSDVLRWNPEDRDYRVSRRIAPDGGRSTSVVHRRPADRARADARQGPSPAERCTASSIRRSATRG